jgi:hypothetical protein
VSKNKKPLIVEKVMNARNLIVGEAARKNYRSPVWKNRCRVVQTVFNDAYIKQRLVEINHRYARRIFILERQPCESNGFCLLRKLDIGVSKNLAYTAAPQKNSYFPLGEELREIIDFIFLQLGTGVSKTLIQPCIVERNGKYETDNFPFGEKTRNDLQFVFQNSRRRLSKTSHP